MQPMILSAKILSSRRRISGFVPLLTLSLAALHPAFGRTPSAAEILDHYVQAAGGANLWHSQKWETDEIEGRALDDDRVVLKATVSTSRSGNYLSEVFVPQLASEGVF